MNILNPAFKGILKLRWSAIDNFLLNPYSTQVMVFNSLIHAGQFTKFGREHNFQQIDHFKDFKKMVPVHEYDDIKHYIQRMMEGEQNILWNTPITWFAKSSGTTSDKSKFIPVSNESLEDGHYKAAKDVLALYYHNFPQSGILSGKCLTLGGSHEINQLNTDSYYGDLSAVMIQNMSYFTQLIRTPDISIALMQEWEEKIEKMAHSTIKEDVTMIAGVPTWTIVLIKKIFEITGKNNLQDVWPNLELYMHGGVNFTPYVSQFKKLIPSSKMHYLETYNASEGFFAAQDVIDREGMLLFLNHGIFYEFMPMEEYGKKFPHTCQLEDVETGKNYAIVISTNAGLWRYIVGDTIQFTSVNPFRIKVSGRLKHFINAFGEEVIVENADHAIACACKMTNAIVNDYTAAPVYFSDNANGCHEWAIEFDKKPDDEAEFIFELDKCLQSINSDYEAKRYKDMALSMPRLNVMPAGTFSNWLKSKGKLGGQHKVPRLSNDRKTLEEILQFENLKVEGFQV
ncbi:MAG: GH3 auxin-responsive promoter family protein [Chitinophagaceae bacterium]|nr:GH3 auxin-responsive promoter family protein [Chitinophagaceae bacterium]